MTIQELLRSSKKTAQNDYQALVFSLADEHYSTPEEINSVCQASGRTLDELQQHVLTVQQRREALAKLTHADELKAENTKRLKTRKDNDAEAARIMNDAIAAAKAKIAKLRANEEHLVPNDTITATRQVANATLNATRAKWIDVEIAELESRIREISTIELLPASKIALFAGRNIEGELAGLRAEVEYQDANAIAGTADSETKRAKLGEIEGIAAIETEFHRLNQERYQTQIQPIEQRIQYLRQLQRTADCIDFEEPKGDTSQ